MTATDHIFKEALTLKPSEKAQLIDKLISSLDKPDKEIDELWAKEAEDRIGEFPEAWHPCSKRTRRCQTRCFPYGIIYQIREQEILVVAIANLHRKPDYWKDRI